MPNTKKVQGASVTMLICLLWFPSLAQGVDWAPVPSASEIPRTPAEAKLLPGAILSPSEESPDKPYDLFSLLLIPDPKWEAANHGHLDELLVAFRALSPEIGGRHLAIWLTGKDTHTPDFERMQGFRAKLIGDRDDPGPYVVIMLKHPEDLQGRREWLVIDFTHRDRDVMMKALTVLSEEIRKKKDPQDLRLDDLVGAFRRTLDEHDMRTVSVHLGRDVAANGVPVSPSQPIPRTPSQAKSYKGAISIELLGDQQYQTFSLFLIPNQQWASANAADLNKLQEVFKDFSVKIGGQHLAVWFTADPKPGVDVRRMQELCRKLPLKLSLTGGPYLVTMRQHPDDLTKENKVLVIDLGNIAAPRIMEVLQHLVSDLRAGGTIDEQGIKLEKLWQSFLTAKDRHGLRGIAIALVTPGE